MSGNPETFSCQGCGKSYRWKSEFAGKKIKCKCGSVMVAPAAQPAPPAEDDEPDLDALYSLAAEGKQAEKAGVAVVGVRCPSCRAELQVGAIVCPQCGFNLKTASKTKAPSSGGAMPAVAGASVAAAAKPLGGAFGFPGAKRGLIQEDTKGNPIIELYVPLGVLAFGIFGVFAQYMWFGDTVHNFAGALPWVFCDIAVSGITLVISCLLAIKMFDLAFGAPGPAVLKIAAIALGPTAIWGSVAHMIGGTMGYCAGCIVAIIIVFPLFHLFFELDMRETLSLGFVVYVVRFFVAPFLIIAIMGAMFASGGAGLIAADQAARNDDNYVLEALDNKPTDDAFVWLNDNKNRMFASTAHEASVQLIQDLSSFGCTKPGTIAIKGEGDTSVMWAKLPRDKAKRKQAFDCYNKFAQRFQLTPKKDTGQTYLLMTTKMVDFQTGDAGDRDRLKITPPITRPLRAA